jgi:hypothetical protein
MSMGFLARKRKDGEDGGMVGWREIMIYERIWIE